MSLTEPAAALRRPKLWTPRRVLVTASALEFEHGRAIAERCEGLGIPVERLCGDRLTGLRGETERDTYRASKSTLAVVYPKGVMAELRGWFEDALVERLPGATLLCWT